MIRFPTRFLGLLFLSFVFVCLLAAPAVAEPDGNSAAAG